VFNLTSSISPNNFIALKLDGSSLWQLEHACQGDRDEMKNIAAADLKSLHLLPFDHCGKTTAVTPLCTLLS
jgi:aminoglycoside phosphotransferase